MEFYYWPRANDMFKPQCFLKLNFIFINAQNLNIQFLQLIRKSQSKTWRLWNKYLLTCGFKASTPRSNYTQILTLFVCCSFTFFYFSFSFLHFEGFYLLLIIMLYFFFYCINCIYWFFICQQLSTTITSLFNFGLNTTVLIFIILKYLFWSL